MPDRMGPPTVQVPPVRDTPPVPAGPPGRPPVNMHSPAGGPPREPAYGRYDEPAFEGGYEPGRHGRADMTTEIRMPTDVGFGGQQYGGPPPGAGMPPPQPHQPSGPVLTGDAARVDQLRRTFQPRRFGSGYDRVQVDRLFEDLVAAFAGRGAAGLTEAHLDPGQFELVSGGYFEAEVNAALREVRDLLSRRR